MIKQWWQNDENVLSLARWMIENEFFSNYDTREDALKMLVDFFEKPWHWTDEWVIYQKDESDETI